MSDERIAATLFAILYEDLTSLSDPQALIYRRRSHDVWQPLGGGLPEPLPAMPYALVAADGLLFADLADGQIWASDDRGDNWTPLRLNCDTIPGLVALAKAMDVLPVRLGQSSAGTRRRAQRVDALRLDHDAGPLELVARCRRDARRRRCRVRRCRRGAADSR